MNRRGFVGFFVGLFALLPWGRPAEASIEAVPQNLPEGDQDHERVDQELREAARVAFNDATGLPVLGTLRGDLADAFSSMVVTSEPLSDRATPEERATVVINAASRAGAHVRAWVDEHNERARADGYPPIVALLELTPPTPERLAPTFRTAAEHDRMPRVEVYWDGCGIDQLGRLVRPPPKRTEQIALSGGFRVTTYEEWPTETRFVGADRRGPDAGQWVDERTTL